MSAHTSRPRVLVLTYSLISREPRALKQIEHLTADYDVTTVGFGPAPDPELRHIELTQENPHDGSLFSRLRYVLTLGLRVYGLRNRYDLRDKAALEILRGEEWDVIIAHDVKTITLANQLRSTRGVLADLHEYAPRQGDESFSWRLLIAPYFRWLCRTEVVKAAAVTTVSQGIVDEYKREYGFSSELVINATPHHDIQPAPVGFPIRLVHSGSPAPARRLEVMIEAVRDTAADVTLDLYLIDGDAGYLQKLKDLAGPGDRIRFHPAVPYTQLVAELNRYDAGISILPPVNFNHLWALPNKFFDYIQARLGVIIGPSPEMRRIVESYGVGGVSEDFTAESLARLLESLTAERVEAWKAASHRNAKELSSEAQVKVWGDIIARLTQGL